MHLSNTITPGHAARKCKWIKICVPLSSAVQGSRVPILPSAVWNYAVWSDPRTAGRAAQILPAHRIGFPDHTVFRTRSGLWRPDFPWCLGAAASASLFICCQKNCWMWSHPTESRDFVYDGTKINPARPFGACSGQPTNPRSAAVPRPLVKWLGLVQ